MRSIIRMSARETVVPLCGCDSISVGEFAYDVAYGVLSPRREVILTRLVEGRNESVRTQDALRKLADDLFRLLYTLRFYGRAAPRKVGLVGGQGDDIDDNRQSACFDAFEYRRGIDGKRDVYDP